VFPRSCFAVCALALAAASPAPALGQGSNPLVGDPWPGYGQSNPIAESSWLAPTLRSMIASDPWPAYGKSNALTQTEWWSTNGVLRYDRSSGWWDRPARQSQTASGWEWLNEFPGNPVKPLRDEYERGLRELAGEMFDGARTPSMEARRDFAVARAWRDERELVRTMSRGTRDWRPEEIEELLKTGKVREYDDYIGHHRNSVNGSPSLARHPDGIEFLTPAEHLAAHSGAWQNATKGRLIWRNPHLAPWLRPIFP
jgi:hypothetical protein